MEGVTWLALIIHEWLELKIVTLLNGRSSTAHRYLNSLNISILHYYTLILNVIGKYHIFVRSGHLQEH